MSPHPHVAAILLVALLQITPGAQLIVASSVGNLAELRQHSGVIFIPPGFLEPESVTSGIEPSYRLPEDAAPPVQHCSSFAQPLVVIHSLFGLMKDSHTSVLAQYHVPLYDESCSSQTCVICWYIREPL